MEKTWGAGKGPGAVTVGETDMVTFGSAGVRRTMGQWRTHVPRRLRVFDLCIAGLAVWLCWHPAGHGATRLELNWGRVRIAGRRCGHWLHFWRWEHVVNWSTMVGLALSSDADAPDAASGAPSVGRDKSRPSEVAILAALATLQNLVAARTGGCNVSKTEVHKALLAAYEAETCPEREAGVT